MRLLKIFGAALCALSAAAQAAEVDKYTGLLPEGASLSLMVQKVGARSTVLDYQDKQLTLPASTQKVVTALAALLQLGPDFRFTTTIEGGGAINNGALNGDLIVRFSGDPTLTRQQLRTMIQSLKQQGVRKVSGGLTIDTSVFASHDKAPGWSWNDMTQCFSAPASAAIIDKNCFSVALQTAKQSGGTATVQVASYYPVQVISQVKTYPRNAPEGRFCEFDVTAGENQRYTLTGCLTPQEKPITLSFSIQDGSDYAAKIIKSELSQAGIQIGNAVRYQTTLTKPGRVLAQTQSAPLHDLLKIMLKNSDNTIADTVFRTMGYRQYGVPGTWRSGSNAVRQVLLKQAGINLGNTVMADGSGLSRHNLIAADTMMQILQYIAQHDQQLDFISMLPTSGQDGTLRARSGFKEAGLTGKVSAKTGALQGVYNLAGFMTTASGERVAFVQFLSGYAMTPQERGNGKKTLSGFESTLYRDIYNAN
ncbi:serine-type D-Ala-D-Ala carboxypeptidase [Leminorella grimontii]|uniref:Serine-type D-Ala-D-Ala carboxypeptidase n=1 Tax=Leminorella grimontii TaxID=82981 RepID=A0AAV5N4F0_9GAMM|nr:serine-type D-Ala-D-Ala carboxypeptidase [Leminorella grimontii]KFC94535.1 D-alanyl-D-alanine carboxypeptidase [Leminorella grimontii ATCC 33999 = DSM 5078]GKX56632.1 serine-type D-Ala-D-Ala carboxypeptidase [Leminorella grimontii]GKX59767.1 serine-type D-Ala-D-Ala carboxypeptidase [Leminorella grimontii]VFS61817.1 D-alanyl-D-alanine carboxypeptidase dacB precursor [Leminorella grimontii]